MTIDDYYNKLNPDQTQLFELLHDLFLSYPEVRWKIRYKIIFYDYHSWLCYINPLKPTGLELCFINGQKLSAFPSILKAKGRKQIAGIEIQKMDPPLMEELSLIFTEAIVLDSKLSKHNN